MSEPDAQAVTEALRAFTVGGNRYLTANEAATLTPTVVDLMESYAAVRVREALDAAADAIEAEGADLSDGDFPDDYIPPGQELPGLAGNSWWRTACEHNGLQLAARIVRSQDTAQ